MALSKVPRLKVVRIGRLVWSNAIYRNDIMFNARPCRHLFWQFWWDESGTKRK